MGTFLVFPPLGNTPVLRAWLYIVSKCVMNQKITWWNSAREMIWGDLITSACLPQPVRLFAPRGRSQAPDGTAWGERDGRSAGLKVGVLLRTLPRGRHRPTHSSGQQFPCHHGAVGAAVMLCPAPAKAPPHPRDGRDGALEGLTAGLSAARSRVLLFHY